MAPADDDRPGGPFQGLPRPAAVLRRARDADLPPPARSRDAVREETWDDEGEDAPPSPPEMRRAPRRKDARGADRARTAAPGTAYTTPAGVPSIAPAGDSAPPRAGLLTPRQRYEGRLATGLGFEGLAAALGLSSKHGERSIRRWEQENPEPDSDDRGPPRYVELLAKHASGIPEVDAYLREHQGRAVPSRDHPPRPVELLLLLAAEVPEVAALLREQGRGAPDASFRSHFRDRGQRQG